MAIADTLAETQIPEARYLCMGATAGAPEACANIHTDNKDTDYKSPDELHLMNIMGMDNMWTGFFCTPCVKAAENSRTRCNECNSRNLDYQTQAAVSTLADEIEHRAQPA